MIETRIFNADVGDDSVGNAGPDAIEQDLDNLYENKAWEKDVLTKSNTIEYIPTHDYHPATKKYIDTKATETLQAVDGLLVIINNDITDLNNDKADKNNVLELNNETEYTPLTDYNPVTKKYVEDEIEELEEELEHEIEKLKIMLVEKTSYGVLSGLEVTAQDEPDMSVNVSEGIIYMQDGERFEVEADTKAIVEADADNKRIDIIYINGTGEVSYYPGTAAAVPEAPETPSGSQLLAEIEVAADATAIETENITDKRKLLDDEVDLLSERITNHYITGTYAGNGTTSDVVLSFEPCMVVIQNSLSPTAYTIIKGYDCKDSATVLGQITETGFTVSDILNTSAANYNYIAFK